MSRTLSLWLHRLWPGRHSPRRQAAGRYQAQLAEARARTVLWGLRPPGFDPVPVRLASEATVLAVQQQLSRILGHLDEQVVADQRFGLTAEVRSALEQQLRAPLAYTLGYLHQDGQRLCHTPIAGLEQMLRTGIAPGARVSLHAWLTLPSHEVIDPTFWAVFPALACAQERECRGLFMHPESMPGRSYHPQWLGEGFVRRIGVLADYAGW